MDSGLRRNDIVGGVWLGARNTTWFAADSVGKVDGGLWGSDIDVSFACFGRFDARIEPNCRIS
ncbi:hypothetical protein [Devosia sp. LC5]|uniref:hypothetical protein n=1 Tax=Devosia sp. LC5 TaxID=1502724 RepID=UPI00126885B9|nr:hypothetical protein [Devosia sp. LC5]